MGLIFFALIAFVAEILVWMLVGKLLGSAWYVFFWFIAAGLIGFKLLRASAAQIMPQLQQLRQGGSMGPSPQVAKHLSHCIAGVLLIIPGLISDLLALLILTPGVHRLLQSLLLSLLQKRQHAMMNKMMGGMMGGAGNPFAEMMQQMQDAQRQQQGRADASIIDGEAREVVPDLKRVDQPKDVK
jgi:UPF0716 protein FxsA